MFELFKKILEDPLNSLTVFNDFYDTDECYKTLWEIKLRPNHNYLEKNLIIKIIKDDLKNNNMHLMGYKFLLMIILPKCLY